MAFLIGGHAYGAAPEALFPWLLAAVASGVGLMVTEVLAWGLHWFGMAKGVSVVAKLVLLLVIPFAWGARVPILLVVLVASAVTSHMPARFRNYSFVYGRRLDPGAPLERGPASST
jgi:biotin transporter BioY